MSAQVKQLCEWYGDGRDGSCPSAQQWEHILSLPSEEPVTLINFFKLREQAVYSDLHTKLHESMTGYEAFNRYASVSVPTMERIGGRFLHVGLFSGMFLGEEEQWDIVAIGAYPNIASLLALYSDLDYRKAFLYRTAACEQQKVLMAKSN